MERALTRDLKEIGEALKAREGLPYDQARVMPAAFYNSDEQLELEREQLFRREWICVGRVDEIARPGAYMAFDILDEPILVVRGEDSEVRALSNVCRHRGTRIAKGSGHGKRLVCPYHAWSYDLAGRLIAAPILSQREDFNCADHRLPAFPCEVWEGFVFVSLDPAVEPLAPRLTKLRDMIANYHFGEMRLSYLVEETWETNWKSLVENFMEGYHLTPLHRSTLHKVTPTRLCRHFAPGDSYFGYYSGFTPGLPRSRNPNPDLTPEEHETCVMYAIPPALVVGGASDYSSFISLQPESAGRVRAKMGLIFYGDDWPQGAIDQAVELFQKTMAEDKEVLAALKRGLDSRHYAEGPLAPADYEGPIWDFYQYLARRLIPALRDMAAN